MADQRRVRVMRARRGANGAAGRARWEAELAASSARAKRFLTTSSQEVPALLGPEDLAALDYSRDLSYPGQYPFTRGVHPSGYRGKLWTQRMFAGFGSAEDTNQRFKNLLEQGQTGLSTAFDMPTLYGYDTDDP